MQVKVTCPINIRPVNLVLQPGLLLCVDDHDPAVPGFAAVGAEPALVLKDVILVIKYSVLPLPFPNGFGIQS